MAFRGEDITEDEIKKLEPIVTDEGFTVENMKSKSAAAANLCSWVISIYTYNRIYVKVRQTSFVPEQLQSQSSYEEIPTNLCFWNCVLPHATPTPASLTRHC